MAIWFEDLKIGNKYKTKSSIFFQYEVKIFSEVAYDRNPLHLDSEYARKRFPFRKMIVHGELIASRMTALGALLIGYDPIMLHKKTETDFLAPLCVGDAFFCEYEVIDKKISDHKRYGEVIFNVKLIKKELDILVAEGTRELVIFKKP
ncbi:hypothetical protein AUK11_00475 [bacterium CG2_30_37_16]|nr:MAG: hypothetical protein AUK11_00475 [bacterium CG2_30_37_16]PIP30394.1 MAG: hypothetical protein COX25_04875 [bacterium (Candidatus Howlettbacteria) CG23_combo_of_CG06-09_8_20_14_all_37_9]PIX98901.1 MAG: hypothetical protein COZ22_03900 [bacterium (Candidatus Howlettbacteria) CG_4_10_14_3_um_filter_37_10]PJB05879.1 MAG: hypothetical protein CO123_03145 [bacterium (Candidatus Howlettbacteria) CG_4_9_14_3_um_filter_37_10]